jgi:hypothetical protein
METDDKIATINDKADEAILLANDVESHGRRWAMIIVGLPAP